MGTITTKATTTTMTTTTTRKTTTTTKKKITNKQLYFPHTDAYKEKFPNNSSRSVSRSCRTDPLNGELSSRFNLVCIIQFLIHFVSPLLHFYMVLSFLTNFVQLSYP